MQTLEASWRLYLNRLRIMSFPEIFFRIGRAVKKRSWDKIGQQTYSEIAAQQRLKVHWYSNISSEQSLQTYLRESFSLRFPMDLRKQEAVLSAYKTRYPDRLAVVCGVADAAIEGKLNVFQLEKAYCGKPINWHHDPATGNQWPLKYACNIKTWRGDVVGEVDYTWRFNRCQHFITLGKAYYLTGQKKYAEALAWQLQNWIESNPYLVGANWTSCLELSIRCLTWLWAINFAIDAEALNDKLLWRILTAIDKQMRYVEEYLSLHSQASNHLIGELAGLYIIGTLLPEFPRSRRWQEIAMHRLIKEMEVQVHPDGVNAEQAIHYHRFVLDFMLLVLIVAEQNKQRLPSSIVSRVKKMLEFLASLMDAGGHVPDYGDTDDGEVLLLSEAEPQDYPTTLCIGSAWFEWGELKQFTKGFSENAFWLLGEQGAEKFEALECLEKESISCAFRQGGYYVLAAGYGEKEHKLVFDCGPLGYGKIAGHGHADTLAIWLSIGGRPFLVDAGTYRYLGRETWRNYFRSTAAHNTITVDDLDQAVIGGPYIWTRTVKGSCLRWFTSHYFDLVEGTHDGYQHLTDPVTHRRAIIFIKPDYWIVWDRLKANAEHQYKQFFHLSHNIDNIDMTSNLVIAQSGRSKLNLIWLGCPNIKLEAFKGNNDPIQGWVSPQYGVKAPAAVICCAQTGQIGQFLTLLLPGQVQHSQDWTMERIPNNSFSSSNASTCFKTTSFRLSRESFIDLWTFRLSSVGTIDIEGLGGRCQFDGEVLGQRYDQSGRLRALLVTQARYLSWNGNVIFQHDKPSDLVMLDRAKEYITIQEDGKCLTERIKL